MSQIYHLSWPTTEKVYIGKTCETAIRRLQVHMSAAKAGQDALLYRAIRKHGAPTLTVLETCESECDSEREIYWIAAFNSVTPNGYNCTEGGDGGKLSSATKAKIREAALIQMADPAMRERISLLQSTRFANPVARAALSESVRASFAANGTASKISEIVKVAINRPDVKEHLQAVRACPEYRASLSARTKEYQSDPLRDAPRLAALRESKRIQREANEKACLEEAAKQGPDALRKAQYKINRAAKERINKAVRDEKVRHGSTII